MDMPQPRWRWTRWIWYAGATAWLFSGIVALRLHHGLHARIALTIAVLFSGAGMFFQSQKR